MKTQKGFTLVEIAIVLVIVGLLLGGVLKGQSLIESAKTNNVIKQLQSFQAAVYGFQDKYQSMPGSLTNASAVIGNGAIDCTAQCDPDIENRNVALALNHLFSAGLITGPAPTAAVAGNNMNNQTAVAPSNPWGGSMFIWQSAAYAGVSPNALAIYTGGNVPASVLAEIDRKIDDGQPLTGSFRSAWPNETTNTCIDSGNNAWELTGGACAGALLF